MTNVEYLAVEMWCGFEPDHPPHLFGETWRHPTQGLSLRIAPCPGKPFREEDE